ncbi:RHS repeat-associated core domain-containing protein [Treponema sp. OMZ 840]|uniref:RHS repeat-associated core domain-containing protein n=1 Tax=Treponema sp. OMZ 840 TaxID=244313 RepID=UPI003D9215B1
MKESSDGRHTVYYRYGADGQRALKSSSQSETLYFNTMWSWIHNSSAYNTDREIKHIYLGSERLVTRTNGAGSAGHTSTAEASTYYYHSDHLGSAHLITDYKGDEYERVEYTPYGEYWIEKRAPENKTLPFKFTGKERDEETGLYYYGARYLDAKTSRWLTTDPALGEYIPVAPVNDEAKKHNQNLPGGGIYNTLSTHLYNYANNNPIKYEDPDGRMPQAVVGAIVGGITGAAINLAVQTASNMINGQSVGDAIKNVDVKSVGAAFLGGAITGAITGGVSSIKAVGDVVKVYKAANIALNASANMTGAAIGTVADNAMHGDELTKNVGVNTAIAGVAGIVMGATTTTGAKVTYKDPITGKTVSEIKYLSKNGLTDIAKNEAVKDTLIGVWQEVLSNLPLQDKNKGGNND